jgi:hypothetical protein
LGGPVTAAARATQTFTDDGANLIGSEVFSYDLIGGEPIAWQELDASQRRLLVMAASSSGS